MLKSVRCRKGVSVAKILLVEDDPKLATVVQEALSAEGHVVDHTLEGEDALYRLKFFHYDLAVVDWTLPDISGVQVCKGYRDHGGQIPILFLTGKTDTEDKLEAFDTGADDYLTKPFHYKELLARVRALLRRPTELEEKKIKVGYLELNVDTSVVSRNGVAVELSPSELILLELFMKNPERTFSSQQLLDRVFTTESDATDIAVRQRILRLRNKIDVEGQPSLIKTLKGLGYKMTEAPQ